MPLTPTPNYNFNIPEPGADSDTWGDLLNENWSSIDSIISALQTQVDVLTTQTLVPIGGLYLSTTDTNPAGTLKYGTWDAYAGGRALVGVGSNGTTDWTAGMMFGEEEVVLDIADLPAHDHKVSVDIAAVPAHSHIVRQDLLYVKEGLDGTVVGVLRDNAGTSGTVTTNGGSHTHTNTVSETSIGNNVAHTNVQPSIAVYVWRRTA